VLDELYTKFPDIGVHVKVLDRADAPLHHRQIDTNLLSSPLLRSLTYQVFTRGYRADTATQSEWPMLARHLEASQNLRVLKIEVLQEYEYDGVHVLSSYPEGQLGEEGLARLELSDDTKLPSLEEFTIREQTYWGSSTYLWDPAHCQLLLHSADWSSLQVLDFGTDLPVAFFSTFKSHLPQVKKLRFGFSRETTGADVQVVKEFIESVNTLQSLVIDQPKKGIEELWHVIKRHEKSLRELILRPSHGPYYTPIYLDISLLHQITQDFPKMERLGWDVPCTSNVRILNSFLRSISWYLRYRLTDDS
jgi:hypothetical protein